MVFCENVFRKFRGTKRRKTLCLYFQHLRPDVVHVLSHDNMLAAPVGNIEICPGRTVGEMRPAHLKDKPRIDKDLRLRCSKM